MSRSQYALVDDFFKPFVSHHIRVKVASHAWEKKGYFKLRRQTFFYEQKILPESETDAQDFKAIPIVALASSWSISCLLYTSPSPRDRTRSRMPSSA